MQNMQQLAYQLRQARARYHLSEVEAATEAGVTLGQLQSLEMGQWTALSCNALYKLAIYYGLDYLQLRALTGPLTPARHRATCEHICG